MDFCKNCQTLFVFGKEKWHFCAHYLLGQNYWRAKTAKVGPKPGNIVKMVVSVEQFPQNQNDIFFDKGFWDGRQSGFTNCVLGKLSLVENIISIVFSAKCSNCNNKGVC